MIKITREDKALSGAGWRKYEYVFSKEAGAVTKMTSEWRNGTTYDLTLCTGPFWTIGCTDQVGSVAADNATTHSWVVGTWLGSFSDGGRDMLGCVTLDFRMGLAKLSEFLAAKSHSESRIGASST